MGNVRASRDALGVAVAPGAGPGGGGLGRRYPSQRKEDQPLALKQPSQVSPRAPCPGHGPKTNPGGTPLV